jgi:hypothetical protein
MRTTLTISILLSAFVYGIPRGSEAKTVFAGERRLNNLVAELLEVSSISQSSKAFTFTRPSAGWIFVTATFKGNGAVRIMLDDNAGGDAVVVHHAEEGQLSEGMRYVAQGAHRLQVECKGKVKVDRLLVKAIPELIHCGLGFDPQIKSYGLYDMAFLKKDILPNVTTLIIPSSLKPAQDVIDDWHRQGKKLVAEVGVDSQARTVEENFKYWTGFYERAPFIDGIIIDEFIVNNPMTRPGGTLSAERQRRMEQERQRHEVYAEAISKIRADDRYKNKMLYAYVGGSGKNLNQEIIGTNLIRAIIGSEYRVALERYLHEMSSPKGSQDALQLFIDGIADWEARQPGVKKHMVIAFGLFSMPPGGINKQPNVDYHVWMDQQMNVVANHPVMAEMAGLNWWTSQLADEETVRFVGKLYRHYGIEGKTNLLTRDPLFLTHIQNADFERGVEGWTLHPAEDGSIGTNRFARYGRIEGRYMGLGRPADPEHIGDTFLWMKRSEKGPNTFSQTVKDLEPGRLYSMKMFSCDYNDLFNPKAKKMEEANKFIGKVVIEGVDIDAKKSFTEMYASNPQPKIPVWITYHWKVFRAKGTSAKLTVSDWPSETEPTPPFGQEQTFNFVEIQPYHE